MTEITATVNRNRASVSLVVTPTSYVSSVMRHDSNGVQPVRFPLGTFPTDRTLLVDDWEAALNGPVTYRSGEAATTITLGGTGPWLTPPLAPSASLPLVSVLDYDAARSSSTEINPLAGGGAVVKLGTMAARTGTFTVLCADHAVAMHLEDLLVRYPQQFLRVPEHSSVDLHFIATGTKVAMDRDSGLWRLSVDYAETAAPTAGLSTWTYGALAAAYPNLGAVAADYGSLAALAVNDRGA